MAKQNKAVSSFEVIRNLVRSLYLEGFTNYLNADSTGKSSRTYSSNLNSIKNFMDSRFISTGTSIKKNKSPVISFNSRQESENPLYALWKSKGTTASSLSFDFALMDILEDHPEGINWYDLTSDSEIKKYGGDCFLRKYTATGIDRKSVKPKLDLLESEGIIQYFENGKKIKKADTLKIRKLIDRPEVRRAIRFASETTPLGVIGAFILDGLKSFDSGSDEFPFHFKHHFIFDTIDSEILYVLLDAIENGKFVEIETKRDGLRTIVPIQIRISTQNGRCHIIFWNDEEKIFYSENIEFILSAKATDFCEYHEKIKKNYIKVEPNLWGVSFRQRMDESLEHVSFTVEYSEKEKYIPNRLKNEANTGTIKIMDEHHARFEAELIDSQEIVPWIRSFIERITELDFPYAKKIWNDVVLLKKEEFKKDEKLDSKNLPHETKLANRTETPLFNSLYSSYYLIVRQAIEFLLHEKDSKLDRAQLDKIIEKNAVLEDRIELYDIIEYQDQEKPSVFYYDGTSSKTRIEHVPDFPLTTLQLRYLATVVRDKRFQLFFGNKQKELLELQNELMHYEPLWSNDSVCYYDQRKDGDDFGSPAYREKFCTIIDAIKNRKSLRIICGKGNTELKLTPRTIDYSQKDNKLRLFFKDSEYPVNLCNIKCCTMIENLHSPDEFKTKYENLKVQIYDSSSNQYHFNRAIRQFSFYKKIVKQIKEKELYEMTVEYDKNDEAEIVIRILQYGPNMKVLEPQSVVEKVNAKVDRQWRRWN